MKKITCSLLLGALALLPAQLRAGEAADQFGGAPAAAAPAQEPPAPVKAVESRGVWVDKSDLYKGKAYLLAALDKLQAANFNTLYLPVWYQGYVTYPGSAIVEQDPAVKKIDPQLMAWLIGEAHKRGFMVQAWTEYGFGTYHTADAASDHSRGVILDKDPGLTAIDKDGKPYEKIADWGYFYHMCPANPVSHGILSDLMVEIVTKLPFDALNLDRVRFPEDTFCFCEHCRKQFLADTGYKLDPSIYSDGVRLAAWRKWRKARVTDFMALLKKKLAAARPGMPVTSAVWYDSELDKKGQDWPEWMRKGYLDFAVPMIYWKDNDVTVDGTAALAPAGTKMAVGISAEDCGKEEVRRQVEHARAKGLGGAAFWFLGPLLDMTDYLHATVFQEPALPRAGVERKPAVKKAVSAGK